MSDIKSEATFLEDSDIKIESGNDTAPDDHKEIVSQSDSATHIDDDSQTDNDNDSINSPPTTVEESKAPVQEQHSRRNLKRKRDSEHESPRPLRAAPRPSLPVVRHPRIAEDRRSLDLRNALRRIAQSNNDRDLLNGMVSFEHFLGNVFMASVQSGSLPELPSRAFSWLELYMDQLWGNVFEGLP